MDLSSLREAISSSLFLNPAVYEIAYCCKTYYTAICSVSVLRACFTIGYKLLSLASISFLLLGFLENLIWSLILVSFF